ncbi:ribonucleotide-diphosphate reductase subunit beta, partial [Burkholderia sp. SIMBA_019]
MLSWDDDVQAKPQAAPQPALQPATLAAADEQGALPPAATQPGILGNNPNAAAVQSERRVNAADKRVINGSTDVNQLVPFK